MAGNDPYTKILLHMDGTHGGTTFTDSNIGGSAHTWTPDTTTTNTATIKFGTASGLFGSGGTGGFLSTPDHADFTLGSSDWTVDLWFNKNGNNGIALGLFCHSTGTASTSAIECGFDSSNQLQFAVSDGTTRHAAVTGAQVTDSLFHHLAVVRTGNTIMMFLDGAQTGSSFSFSSSIPDPTTSFRVGRVTDASSKYFGFLDEFRLSVGIARWTSTFTPPTAAYDEIGDGVGAATGTGTASGVGSATAETAGSAAGTGTALADSTGSGINSGVGSATGAGEAMGIAIPPADVIGASAAYAVRGFIRPYYTVEGSVELP